MTKENIVSLKEFPIDIWYMEKNFPDQYKQILKGASMEVPWEGNTLILKKIKRGTYDKSLIDKTKANKKKIKISKDPVAYTIHQFSYRFIPLYKIIEQEKDLE